MKRNTSLLLLFVFCFLSLVFSGEGVAGTLQDVKTRGKLITGVKVDYPPFGFLDKKGVHKGFDIAKALSKELFGNEDAVEFVSVTSENRIAFLTSGKIAVPVANHTLTATKRVVVKTFNQNVPRGLETGRP